MSVTGLAFNNSSGLIYSGSRDCTVKVTDMSKPGFAIRDNKILRNVVTDLVYCDTFNALVQLSEDLQLRVYSSDLKDVKGVMSEDGKWIVSPNQFVRSWIVGSTGSEVVIGTKGFSWESIELWIVDLRKNQIRKRI